MYLAIASPRFLPLKNTLGSEVLAALHVRAWQRALLAELGGFACVSGKNVYLLLGDGSRSSGAPISELPRIASRGLPNVGLAHVAFRPSDVRGGLTQTVGHLLLWAANLTSIAAWDSSVDAIGAVRTALSDPSARQVCLDAALTYPCLGHSEAGLHSRVGEEQGRALGGRGFFFEVDIHRYREGATYSSEQGHFVISGARDEVRNAIEAGDRLRDDLWCLVRETAIIRCQWQARLEDYLLRLGRAVRDMGGVYVWLGGDGIKGWLPDKRSYKAIRDFSSDPRNGYVCRMAVMDCSALSIPARYTLLEGLASAAVRGGSVDKEPQEPVAFSNRPCAAWEPFALPHEVEISSMG